jgi:two-component sensor histidine kinase
MEMAHANVSQADINPAWGASPEPWLLVAEIAHRVANQYAAAIGSISVAAARCANSDAKAALAGVAQQLHYYADAHRALQAPVGAGPMDLAYYLRQLCTTIARSSLDDRQISLTLIEESIEIDSERCWRAGLIVSELITNAARHGLRGQSGMIVLEMSLRHGLVQCLVTDDGHGVVGFTPGHGSRIIEALAQDLGGNIERKFGPRGAAVLLSFPQTRSRPMLGPDEPFRKSSPALNS